MTVREGGDIVFTARHNAARIRLVSGSNGAAVKSAAAHNDPCVGPADETAHSAAGNIGVGDVAIGNCCEQIRGGSVGRVTDPDPADDGTGCAGTVVGHCAILYVHIVNHHRGRDDESRQRTGRIGADGKGGVIQRQVPHFSQQYIEHFVVESVDGLVVTVQVHPADIGAGIVQVLPVGLPGNTAGPVHIIHQFEIIGNVVRGHSVVHITELVLVTNQIGILGRADVRQTGIRNVKDARLTVCTGTIQGEIIHLPGAKDLLRGELNSRRIEIIIGRGSLELSEQIASGRNGGRTGKIGINGHIGIRAGIQGAVKNHLHTAAENTFAGLEVNRINGAGNLGRQLSADAQDAGLLEGTAVCGCIGLGEGQTFVGIHIVQGGTITQVRSAAVAHLGLIVIGSAAVINNVEGRSRRSRTRERCSVAVVRNGAGLDGEDVSADGDYVGFFPSKLHRAAIISVIGQGHFGETFGSGNANGNGLPGILVGPVPEIVFLTGRDNTQQGKSGEKEVQILFHNSFFHFLPLIDDGVRIHVVHTIRTRINTQNFFECDELHLR